jgi:hypothetical protein
LNSGYHGWRGYTNPFFKWCLKIEVLDLFKAELPREHPAFDTLHQYNDDVKLIINRANSDLKQALDAMLKRYSGK